MTTEVRLFRSMIAAAILCAALACKSQRDAGAAALGDSTTTTASDTGAASTPTSGGLSDANIIFLLDEANKADSATGAYALPKATSPDVKAFARLMMSEHHALRAQGQELAKRLNTTPEKPANDPLPAAAQSEMTALRGATKSGFDRMYIDQEIGMHKAVLDLAGKGHDAAQSPELKKLIEQAGPVVQAHLDRAEAIQKKLGKPAA